jgi:hypothetical protein
VSRTGRLADGRTIVRRPHHHIIRLAATGLAACAVLAPAATAKVDVPAGGDARPAECAAWAQSMSAELALYGIVGAQAESYMAQRLDNPCHSRITPRSLFHAGDPGQGQPGDQRMTSRL